MNNAKARRNEKRRKAAVVHSWLMRNKVQPFCASTKVGLVAIGTVNAKGARGDTVLLTRWEAIKFASALVGKALSSRYEGG